MSFLFPVVNAGLSVSESEMLLLSKYSRDHKKLLQYLCVPDYFCLYFIICDCYVLYPNCQQYEIIPFHEIVQLLISIVTLHYPITKSTHTFLVKLFPNVQTQGKGRQSHCTKFIKSCQTVKELRSFVQLSPGDRLIPVH